MTEVVDPINSLPFLIIDEQGLVFDDPDAAPIDNPDHIREIFGNLKLSDSYFLETEWNDQRYLVESFDHPLQIVAVEFKNNQTHLQICQNFLFLADDTKWSVDEWDRFNGFTNNHIPFVLTTKAQDQLFKLADSYDDEGFVAQGKYIPTPPYFELLAETAEVNKAKYWSDIYKSEGNPGWNLNGPAETLKDMLPRLKLPKSRVLVLGCGEGHDAAFFAEAGHVVTAVDFSGEAIQRATQRYATHERIKFFEMNAFHLPQEWNHSFDLVVEHTCFCAIPPDQRNELIRVWRRMLHDEGQLLATFFVMEKQIGPPFGATEWELRRRLQKYFQFLFWGRWRKSIPQRQARELFVLAQKKRTP